MRKNTFFSTKLHFTDLSANEPSHDIPGVQADADASGKAIVGHHNPLGTPQHGLIAAGVDIWCGHMDGELS